MPQKFKPMHGLVLFRNLSRKWGSTASASPGADRQGARTTPRPYVHWLFLVLALSSARIRETLEKARKKATFIFRLAMEKRPIFGVVYYQRYTAVLRMSLLVVLTGFLAFFPVDAQESPDESAGTAAHVVPDQGPAKVTGEPLADYLRALAEAQSARADAETARADAIAAQATLAQAIRSATDARAVLGAVVSRLAAESSAPVGWSLGLDGEWRAPERSGATAGP